MKQPIEGVKGCQSVFWGHCDDPDKIKAFEAAIEQMDFRKFEYSFNQ
ncbi:MAG: hypothetical protein EZY12_21860 [Dolichospermum sp. DET69]|nr:hypothetical protein [Dolichospermum sp. DET66]MBS3034958.1 hypothetical protein [Dolichospermum sp. DET67]QSX67333.1 MAG: hypothetical protein EZY12_21860 [Dolichospermum sp. DET69]